MPDKEPEHFRIDQVEPKPLVIAVSNEFASLRSERDAAIRAAQEAVYNTTRLTRLLTILSEPAPLRVLLDRLLETLSELFSADVVVLLDPAGTGSFSPLASIGLPEDLAQIKFSESSEGYITSVMKSRTPILITNVRIDEKIDPQLRELDIETAVWLPIVGRYEPRGALLLARCQKFSFEHTDVSLLMAMTYRIGLVLEQAQHSIQIERIAQTIKEIGYHLDQSTICSDAAKRFPSIIGADISVFVLLEQGSDECSITEVGVEPGQVPAWCDLARSLIHENCFTLHDPINIPVQNMLGNRTIAEILNYFPVHALLAVPIFIKEQLQGVLIAARFPGIPFDPDTLQIALLFVGQISAAIENAQLYQAVREELIVRQRIEQALRARDERFSAMIRSVSDVIAILNQDGIINYASPAAEVVWGCSPDSLQGQAIFDRIHIEDRQIFRDLVSGVQAHPNITITGYARVQQNIDIWRTYDVIMTNLLHEPAVEGIVSTFHDITERKNYEQELKNLAFRDALTGLANRNFFVTKLRDAFNKTEFIPHPIGLIFFDLDNFKIVNDSLGHYQGDEVLRTVANRIRSCLREEDTAARLGGDEFTILIENFRNMGQIVMIARRILQALQDPIDLTDRELYVSCSIGIAISAPKGDNPENLLRKADLAMYKAKSNGKGGYAIFDLDMNAKAIERLDRETELRWAIQHKELRVFYQPILSLDDHQLVAVEALIRWQHPTRGLITPAEIIPLAEETGLIIEIGQWVLNEACRQIFAWKKMFPEMTSLSLNVNLSMRQFISTSLVSDINHIIRNSGLNPSSLILEITESSLFHEPDVVIAKLKKLKDIGVRLSIDDFGTGFASLNYLKQFPVDEFKIDRSFIQGIVENERDKAIVQSMIDLAVAFGVDVVGEGIETEEQASLLYKLGCNRAQGFLYSPALPADSLESHLKSCGLSWL